MKYVVAAPFDGHKRGDMIDTATKEQVDQNLVVPIADAKPDLASQARPPQAINGDI